MHTIDPITSLAFSALAGKGTYGVFLGAGVSVSSGIPSGWDITKSLITLYAAGHGIEAEESLEWYEGEVGPASYSTLLEGLFHSQSHRSEYLSGLIEKPLEETGTRPEPTQAHRAVADLVSDGFVRVIITTNFDRLLEEALGDVGITPTVIHNEDSAKGASPYVHNKCTILKIHGDYRDTRSLNTADELKSYSPTLDNLLDRWLDEFGWIVAGWSADWDHALLDAWLRCTSRRFPTYWTHLTHQPLGSNAETIVNHRGASTIQSESADVFFSDLRNKIFAIEATSRPHLKTVTALIALTKRFSSEEKYRIQLHDLVNTEMERTRATIDTLSLDVRLTPEDYVSRIDSMEGTSAGLCTMLAHGVRWAQPWSLEIWLECIGRLSRQRREGSYHRYLVALTRYPLLLAFYTAGIACLINKNWVGLLKVFNITVVDYESNSRVKLMSTCMSEWIFDQQTLRDAGVNQITPGSERILTVMKRTFANFITPDEAELILDRFDYIAALHTNNVWTGRLFWRLGHTKIDAAAWFEDLIANDDTLLGAGLCQNDHNLLRKNIDAVAEQRKKRSW